MKHKIALLGLGTVGLGTYQLIEMCIRDSGKDKPRDFCFDCS